MWYKGHGLGAHDNYKTMAQCGAVCMEAQHFPVVVPVFHELACMWSYVYSTISCTHPHPPLYSLQRGGGEMDGMVMMIMVHGGGSEEWM